jgi:hypothetical protein
MSVCPLRTFDTAVTLMFMRFAMSFIVGPVPFLSITKASFQEKSKYYQQTVNDSNRHLKTLFIIPE